jgi:hypothetical protein
MPLVKLAPNCSRGIAFTTRNMTLMRNMACCSRNPRSLYAAWMTKTPNDVISIISLLRLGPSYCTVLPRTSSCLTYWIKWISSDKPSCLRFDLR